MIILLIDDGIPGYGHRVQHAQPDWKDVARFYEGKNWINGELLGAEFREKEVRN